MSRARKLGTPKGVILTHTGVMLDLFNAKGDQINLTDISQGLALTCRYGAQSRHFCSVAQHSVHVYEYVRHHAPNDRVSQAWALLHDAAEAYIGDVPTPLKETWPWYRAMEDGLMGVILERFGLPSEEPQLVSEGDAAVLNWEWPELMPEHEDMKPLAAVEPFTRKRWHSKSHQEARHSFCKTAEALGLYDV